MAEQVNPTRMELIARKAQIQLVSRGRDVLKQKMDVLLLEIGGVVDDTLKSKNALDDAANDALFSLAMAQAVDGAASVKSAAFAAKREVLIHITGKKLMGIAVPMIRKESFLRPAHQRGYGLIGTSSRIGEAAEKFEEELDHVIEVAEFESTVKRVGEELRKTRRRVNALENVLIPELLAQTKYISFRLEELERENFFRLKKVKAVIEKRKKKHRKQLAELAKTRDERRKMLAVSS